MLNLRRAVAFQLGLQFQALRPNKLIFAIEGRHYQSFVAHKSGFRSDEVARLHPNTNGVLFFLGGAFPIKIWIFIYYFMVK